MVIPSFFVLMLYPLGNFHGMAVNYHSKSFITLSNGGKLKYHSNILQNLNPRKCSYSGKVLHIFTKLTQGPV